MYDELIKNLRHDSASALQNCEFDFVHDWMLKAADVIEELVEDRDMYIKAMADEHNRAARLAWEHRWIPVTERLPEKYNRVFVYSKATRIGRGIDFINADGNWFSTQKVSHWMPLPEPPKSEDD